MQTAYIEQESPDVSKSGVVSNSERKCTDWCWIIWFLAVFIFIIGFGLSGLHDIRHLSFCNKVLPPTAHSEIHPQLHGLYDGCFSPLIRGSSNAGAFCTLYAVSLAMDVYDSQLNDVSEKEAIAVSVQSLVRPNTDSYQISAPGDISECWSYLSGSSFPSDECIFGVVELLFGKNNSYTLVSECLLNLYHKKPDALTNCVRYAVSQASQPAVPIFNQCLNSGDTSTQLTCFSSQLLPVFPSTLHLDQLINRCLKPLLSSSEDITVAGCLSYAIDHMSLDAILPLETIDNAYNECLLPLLSKSPGALINCAKIAGMDIVLPTAVSSCMNYSGSPGFQTCSQAGLKLVLGEEEGSALYRDCIRLIVANDNDAVLFCASYAVSRLNSSLAVVIRDCIPVDVWGGPQDDRAVIDNCLETRIRPYLGPRVSSILESCLYPTIDWLFSENRQGLSSNNTYNTFSDASLYMPCIGTGLSELTQSFALVGQAEHIFENCVLKILDGDVDSLLSCASSVALPIAIPEGAFDCLSFDGPLGLSDGCIVFALSLFGHSDSATQLYSSCLSGLITGQHPMQVARTCASYAAGLLLDTYYPDQRVVIDNCIADLSTSEQQITCIRSVLDSLISSSSTESVMNNCISNVLTSPSIETVGKCVVYVLSRSSWSQIGGNPIAKAQDIYDHCVAKILDSDPAAIFDCASYAKIPIPVPTAVQNAITHCLSYIVRGNDLAFEKCTEYAMQLFLPRSFAHDAIMLCVLPVLRQSPFAIEGCVRFALSQHLPQSVTVIDGCIASSDQSTVRKTCIASNILATYTDLPAEIITNCIDPLTADNVDSRLAVFNCLSYTLVTEVTTHEPKLESVINSMITDCMSKIIMQEEGATASCLRFVLLQELGSESLYRMISKGLTKALPSDSIESVLTGECLAKLIEDPKSSVGCFIQGLVVGGAQFAVSSLLSSLPFNANADISVMNSFSTVNTSISQHMEYPHNVDNSPINEMYLAVLYSLQPSPQDNRKSFHVHDLTHIVQPRANTLQSASMYTALSSFSLFSDRSMAGLGSLICEDVFYRGNQEMKQFYGNFMDEVWMYRFDILRVLAWALFFACLLSLGLMFVISRHAESLIRFSIIIGFLNLFILIIINFAILNFLGAIFLLAALLFKSCWYFWVRNQLKFVAAIFRASLNALKKNPGPFIVSAGMFCLTALWCVLWVCALYKFYSSDYPSIQQFGDVVFILSFFWVTEVSKNVIAVTISGVIGTWYYYANDKDTTHLPTFASFWRAITYSFGSICLGSLIIAALKTFIYFYKKAKNTKKKWLKALILCTLQCLEKFLQIFNMFAFVELAISGKSYFQSAHETFALMKKAGLEAITTDDMVDGVLGTGRVAGALILFAVSGIVASKGYDLPWSLVMALMFVSMFIGYAIISMASVVVEIACATLFVCFAKHPQMLQKNEPILHQDLMEAWEKRHQKFPSFLSKKKKLGDQKTSTEDHMIDIEITEKS